MKNQNNLTAEQQQLVNEILNRKQLEVESLVEATLKSDKNDTKEEIVKKQKEILNKKVKENEEKIAKNKREKNRRKKHGKKTEGNKVKQSYLEDAKRRDEWEKRQTEKFREEQKKKNKIRDRFREQLEALERRERLEEKRRRQQDHIPMKTKDEEKMPKIYRIKNVMVKHKKNKKEKNNNYKLIKGMKRYIENIRFYEVSKNTVNKKHEKGFKEKLAFSINHKKALENIEANNQEQKNIEPRYI